MLHTIFSLLLITIFFKYCLIDALKIPPKITKCSTRLSDTTSSFELARKFLENSLISSRMCLLDSTLRAEMESANFWTVGSFVINKVECVAVTEKEVKLKLDCTKQGKALTRNIVIPLPLKVTDDDILKTTLIVMAKSFDCIKETKAILDLPFGKKYDLPLDFKFNQVPHSQWLRSYLYDSVKNAILKAIYDNNFVNKSRIQVKFNIPEVNPAFDTYRIGTILECVRHVALALACDEGKRVRICVQQSLGEGVFTGLPLALASMRVILEKMDWGGRLSDEEKAQKGDSAVKGTTRKEAMIRFGEISGQDLSPDDDVIIVIAPQNVIGGMVIEYLEEMVEAAGGRPMILINPSLGDRPSSNNVMQIRGRAERKAFADSFLDIFEMRLLYPSSGGYMFPIGGLVYKQDHTAPWVIYKKDETDNGREVYTPLAALPPYPTPDRTVISNLFTNVD